MILFIGLHKFLNSNNSSAKLILQSDFFNLYGLSYLLSEFDYPDEGIRIVDDKCKVKQSKVIFGLYSALPLSLPLFLSSSLPTPFPFAFGLSVSGSLSPSPLAFTSIFASKVDCWIG